MSDAEVKDLNQVRRKETYHLPSGRYIQFIHDHAEKTYDVWEIMPDGVQKLLESQPTTVEPFAEFKSRIIKERFRDENK